MAKSHTQGALPTDILTVRQVADEWSVSIRTIQRYIASGRIKATRLPGGQHRIKRADAEAALRSEAS